MNNSKVFIETTIQIRRLLGGTAEQRRIVSLLADKHVITSAYVFMEFRRTILQDLSFLRSIAQQKDREGVWRTNLLSYRGCHHRFGVACRRLNFFR